jgi:hypothetical protein
MCPVLLPGDKKILPNKFARNEVEKFTQTIRASLPAPHPSETTRKISPVPTTSIANSLFSANSLSSGSTFSFFGVSLDGIENKDLSEEQEITTPLGALSYLPITIPSSSFSMTHTSRVSPSPSSSSSLPVLYVTLKQNPEAPPFIFILFFFF